MKKPELNLEDIDVAKIDNIVFGTLLNRKISSINLNKSEEILVLDIAKNFFLAGHLLNLFDSIKSNEHFLNELKKLKKIFLIKKMSIDYDLDLIIKSFKKKKINFVLLKGAALSRLNLYDSGERQYRDLDILIHPSNIEKAYKELRKLGFIYANKFASDGCSYLGEMHHLPPLINDRKTIVELHHRVTKNSLVEECILSKKMLKSAKIHESITSDTSLIAAHLIYHGTKHDNKNYGPRFLIDLKRIYDKEKQISVEKTLIENLSIEQEYNEIKAIFDEISCSESLAETTLNRIKAISGNYLNTEIISGKKSKLIKLFNLKFFQRVLNKLKFIQFEYQVSFYSLRYLKVLLIELFKTLRNSKIRLY